MTYTKINWQDLPSTDTPITSENLGHMDDGIEEAHNLIDEIKDAEIYSTNEVKTNKVWIDGKPIYRKVIDIGNLPNSTSKTINHNISNLDNFIDIRGTAIRAIDKDTFTLPYVTFNANNAGGIIFYANETNIYVRTSSDRSNYNGKFILEYTKTTD